MPSRHPKRDRYIATCLISRLWRAKLAFGAEIFYQKVFITIPQSPRRGQIRASLAQALAACADRMLFSTAQFPPLSVSSRMSLGAANLGGSITPSI